MSAAHDLGFAHWQAEYARHGVATFPVRVDNGDKIPAIRGYLKVGLRGSAQLALKFPSAATFGFQCGGRNRITIIDMDSADASIVAECEKLFGPSPAVWRTGGGKWAMAYRFNGEARRIRPIANLPVDILGGGFAVAPPSAGVKRDYAFCRGTIADFDRLPRMRRSGIREILGLSERIIPNGKRNNELFRYCRSVIAYCDTLDQLIDAARSWADQHLAVVPDKVSDSEIIKTCNSVWQFRGGRRRIGMNPLIVEGTQWRALVSNPKALALTAYLSAENRPDAEFLIADGLGEALGWSRRTVPAARRFILELGLIKEVRRRGKNGPRLYRWQTIV